MSNLSGLKNKARNIVNKYYPTVECAILTGSQLEAEFVAPTSDIDIVIISKKFSGLTSYVIKDGETKIDFTRIGLNQIQLLLIDNAYDHQGIVLTMLSRGVVIKDDLNIYGQIGKFARKLLRCGNLSANTGIKELRREMIKLKKHLKKDLETPYYFFMLADFIKLISSFHLFSINKGQYDKDAFRIVKSIYYKEGNLNFPTTIMEVVNNSLKNINESRPILMYYIDKYLDLVSLINKTEDEIFIVNLQTLHMSKSVFYEKAIKEILSNKILSKHFKYCQMNYSANIFPNKYILFFNPGIDEFNQQLIIKELFDVFYKMDMRIIQINTIQSDYLKYIFPNQDVYKVVEKIQRKITNLNITVGKTKKYNSQKAIIICFILAIILANKFKMNRIDIKKISKHLFVRWRPSRIISNLKNEKEVQMKNKIFVQYNSHYYHLNKNVYDKIHSAINSNNSNQIKNFNTKEFEATFIEYIEKIKDSVLPMEEVHKHLFETTDSKKSCYYYYYISLLDMITNTMGVEFEDKSKLAFIIRKLY